MKNKIFHICNNGYKYDRRIFWGVMAILIFYIFLAAWANDFSLSYKFYFVCDQDICTNPLINTEIKNSVTGYNYKNQCTAEWCKKELLSRGIYGAPPSLLYRYFLTAPIILTLFGLALNHILHNRGVKPSIKLNLSDETINKLKEAVK